MTAVWQHSKAKGAARLLLLAIADAAHDSGELSAYRRSHQLLSQKTLLAQKNLGRVVQQLVELGELQVIELGSGHRQSSYQILLPGLDGSPQVEGTVPSGGGGRPRAVRGQTPRGEGTDPLLPVPPVQDDAAVPAAAPTHGQTAHRILTAVIARKREANQPEPTNFKARLAMLTELVRCGHDPAALEDACMTARTITTSSIEFELSKRAEAKSKTGPRYQEPTHPTMKQGRVAL